MSQVVGVSSCQSGFRPESTTHVIKNTQRLITHGRTASERKARRDICKILEAVLRAVDPYALVKKNLEPRRNRLIVARSLTLDLNHYRRIFVVGAGKAVYKMALAVEDILRSRIVGGCINIPTLPSKNHLRKIVACKARHPTPDIRGVYGTKQIAKTLKSAGKDDLVIAVISGGGSALMPFPAQGITLKEKIALTSLLLKTPATIHEINVVRKHLSQIKGGQFACMAYPATLITLYISDIIDDPFDIQASGPTAPDPSTFKDAMVILKKYEIWDRAPKAVRARLTKGAQGLIPETPNASHEAFCKGRIYNFTIGNHNTAVEAAGRAGRKLGYHTLELTSAMQGEAREAAKGIVAIGKHIVQYRKPVRPPALLVAGGETTVHVRGKGAGGRNQELVLAALTQLRNGMTIASFGTDGVDGMTPLPVAGAIADVGTRERAMRLRIDPQKFLANNDSYHFFTKVRNNILTGPTGTNVGDLILLAMR